MNRLAGLAALADGDRQPARAAAGSGHAPVAVNREERAPEDGLIVVGRNPDGTTDHSVDLLRVDDLDGNPIAVVASYAAHPVVMGFETYHLSQDFPGVRPPGRGTGDRSHLPLPHRSRRKPGVLFVSAE